MRRSRRTASRPSRSGASHLHTNYSRLLILCLCHSYPNDREQWQTTGWSRLSRRHFGCAIIEVCVDREGVHLCHLGSHLTHHVTEHKAGATLSRSTCPVSYSNLATAYLGVIQLASCTRDSTSDDERNRICRYVSQSSYAYIGV